MKKLLVLLLSISSLNAGLQDKVITHDGKPNQKIISLLKALNIEHDAALSSIVAATQKEQPVGFLRPKNLERWQLDAIYSDEQKKIIREHAEYLGMTAQINPTLKKYDYAVLMGATVQRVRSRLAFMVKLWNSGIRWDKIIFLAGDRPLDKDLESEQELYNENNGLLTFKPDWQKTTLPKTETEMMAMVFEQSELPAEWHNITKIVPTAMHANGARPTTIDTVQTWLATNPKPGSILSFSNQPFAGYQDAIFQSQLDDGFTLETVGHQESGNTTAEVFVDTIARWLYAVKSLVK